MTVREVLLGRAKAKFSSRKNRRLGTAGLAVPRNDGEWKTALNRGHARRVDTDDDDDAPFRTSCRLILASWAYVYEEH